MSKKKKKKLSKEEHTRKKQLNAQSTKRINEVKIDRTYDQNFKEEFFHKNSSLNGKLERQIRNEASLLFSNWNKSYID